MNLRCTTVYNLEYHAARNGQHVNKMELQNKIQLDSKFLLDILENISTSVIVLNEDGSYLFVNSSALDLLGLSNKFPELSSLKPTIGHMSIDFHIKSVNEDNHSKMLRDFKFKNFEGHEKIVDCNISQASFENKNVTLIEFTETGRLYTISLEQNLIEQDAMWETFDTLEPEQSWVPSDEEKWLIDQIATVLKKLSTSDFFSIGPTDKHVGKSNF